MKKYRIAILGAGNMATAMAYHLSKQKHEIILYCIEPEVEKQINSKHRNDKYLKGVTLPKTISATANLQTAVEDAQIMIVAIPSNAVLQVLQQAAPFMRPDLMTASLSKGFDAKTGETIALAQKNVLPAKIAHRLCMLGGPAIANELVQGQPMAFVVAGQDKKTRQTMAQILTADHVKAAQSSDLPGVSLAAALKNAYAIALGFCDGLKYPTNTKAFVVTMAVSEMAGMMLKSGADPKSAPSLAGLGDLLVTGWSPHGRNRQYGEMLVKAKTNDPKSLGLTTVEGIAAARQGLKLSKKLGTRTPLLSAIHHGINARKDFHQPFVNYLKNIKLGDV